MTQPNRYVQAIKDSDIEVNDIQKFKGIFGLGISTNYYLDLLNLAVLGFLGLIIIFFFSENFNKTGESGPARTTIWGLGLTGTAIFFMLFISISKNIFTNKANENIFERVLYAILNDGLPIIVTFMLIAYALYLNFVFYKKINSDSIANSYKSYSKYSYILIGIQLIFIVKYLYNKIPLKYGDTQKSDSPVNSKTIKESLLIKNVSLILSTVNFILMIIMNILLEYFSTDG
jgi:hypothetical protein